jgi:hypothetical protein
LIVKTIRLDNAGENGALEHLCNNVSPQIQFEYTSPGTPQYNGHVERKFATLYGKIRSVLNAIQVPQDLRKCLWAEAANWVTNVENCLVTETKLTPSYTQFYNKPPTFQVIHFGEIGIVTSTQNSKIKARLTNRGIPCINLGLAPNHSSNIYRMLNLDTKRVIISRDISWLQQSYGSWKGLSHDQISTFSHNEIGNDDPDDSLDDVNEPELIHDTTADILNEDNNITEPTDDHINLPPPHQPTTESPPSPPLNDKTVCEMKKLQGFFNPTATARVVQHTQALIPHSGEDPRTRNESSSQDDRMSEQKSQPSYASAIGNTTMDGTNILLD